MLKGLMIRQLFVVVDLALALFLAVVVYQLVALQFGRTTVASAPIIQPEAAPVQLATLKPMSEYAGIPEKRLFGDAGVEAVVVPVEPITEVVETTAPLTLHATVASAENPGDPLATAVIENAGAPTVIKIGTYYMGQAVNESLTLIEVYPRKVILRNAQLNRNEELKMAEPKPQAPGSLPAPPQLAMTGRQRRNAQLATGDNSAHAALNRQEVMDELNAYDPADLMTNLNPEMVTDESGNTVGITSANFGSIPVAGQVGLQNGDVVNSVNGIGIDSEAKLYEIAQKLQNASTFRLGITRNGQPQMLTFRLE